MTRLEIFGNLGYRVDPFRKARFATGDMTRTMRILTMAVESHAMVSIVGDRGIGKSEAVGAALDKLGVRRVVVNRAQKEKTTIADIEKAIILDLSDESPKRGAETCSRQVRRIMGEASRKQKIALVIEEAQRLHASTLRSLKTLREIEWMGEKELFTVILVAQSDPMNRSGVSEVRLRTDMVRMQGLSANEAAQYVRRTLGKHFEAAAIDQLTELPQATNYLDLQELCVRLLNIALADGREQVSTDDVNCVCAAEPTPVPAGTQKKAVTALSGKDALASVLARKNGKGNVEEMGRAVGC
ncbi:MAG: ATP-binding protein [Clostridiaceae bacterium]